MTAFQAIFLGIVQGLTEFLPVSSSGHLIFLPIVFGWEDQGIAFDVMVHLGSLVAVILYFRTNIWKLLRAFFSRGALYAQDRRLAWFILLSIIPAGIVGVLLDSNSRSALVVGISLICWGILLGVADRYSKKRTRAGSDVQHLRFSQVVVISLAQAVALIPGTSRSGITMTAGLFSGLTKKAAAEFSFLMSIPIIVAAGLLKTIEFVEVGFGDIAADVLLLGAFSAALSGWIAIAALMKIIQKWSFLPFVVYRIIVGVIILVTLL
ncbi:MAG: undecaprenyl-diphosphatase [Candidatus Magasanikbacteria bacterium CG10_big_fil_rev_8_21_14_0_10_43_6]|uniref:Undecaprenyl-diphosphatase n=1 Tax=Candidatus Magasanikbacteria bacterium CG10_big_fil_rev_8_21_14_0_10_43_6 TaxID=1974650 RepID=A0A2M6W286_9BACT|nr:MAG: undecaprenyl-diphosphatase [Candidatus Magasanikbacteria bacterium CG10_big_fil_rev_8_21_14_0_10_43_6]